MFPKTIKQQRAARAQKSRSAVTTLPSPTGGWNARDAISDMPPTDAVQMVNIFPQTTSCNLRDGSVSWQDALQYLNISYLAPALKQTATTPSLPINTVTGDIDVRMKASLNWATYNSVIENFIGKANPAVTGNFGWGIVYTPNPPAFGIETFFTLNGSTLHGYSSTVGVPFTDGQIGWIRVTRVAATGVLTYYTSTDYNQYTETGTWTQLGATLATVVGSIFASTADVSIGLNNVNLNDSGPYHLYYAEVRNGIDGTFASVFDANNAIVGSNTFVSGETKEVWTLNNGASINNTLANVETIMAYTNATATKIIAISGGKVFDVTTQYTRTDYLLSLTNSRAQYINVATPAGTFLMFVNGADSPYLFNGTTWTNPVITGVTASTFIHINLFKNRIWFIEKNSLSAWYLPTLSIAGAAAELDLSAFAVRGGYLVAMATWTIDAGYGMDDYAVFITSEGEVIVFGGTDPSSAATWSMIGVFWVGSPVGRRCFVKYAGDVLIICQDGLMPLSGALQSSRLNPRVALSDKIKFAMSEAVTAYGANFGWQILPFPKQNIVFVNVPIKEGQEQEQYAMNTITGSWARFQDWNANCWELIDDEIFFGGNYGVIRKAWFGQSDNGQDIDASCLQAFNYFGSQGQQKHFTMMRPVFLANGDVPVSMRMNLDFNQNTANDVNSFTDIIVTGALWDQAIWDADVWANDFLPSSGWRGANGVGFCGAPEMGITTSDRSVKWLSTDIVIEGGAIL